MNHFKYLSPPASPSRSQSYLYRHENAPLENTSTQPSPIEKQNHQKPNFLSMSGKKFLSLLTPTKYSKLEQKRPDTAIPATKPPTRSQRKGARTVSGKELGRTETGGRRLPWSLIASQGARHSQSGGITGHKFTFQSGRRKTSANANREKWLPVRVVVVEEMASN
ncbi:hypothetical protein C7212DRAFT_364448 [Tuber magnatum]|uniref:Uncharacterized protein n=1 Tax=Tuber magnatum TaxID=42249 RepID=A0A317SLG4_9PEZI|nr:hypothetical protein C7212DRAFT_364448 [Tuber magnatum]